MSEGVRDIVLLDEDSSLGIGVVPAASDGSLRKIASGDVIQFARKDYHGAQRAVDVSMVFSYEEYLKTGNGQLFGGNNIGAVVNARRYVDGTVYEKDGNLIMVTDDDIKGGGLPEEISFEILNASRGTMYKLDKRARQLQVIKASSTDIIPYSVSGANCSRIFYYAEWGWQDIFYIYK